MPNLWWLSHQIMYVCHYVWSHSSTLCSMEPRIDEEPNIAHPGPEDPSLLTQQWNHQSEDIWNGKVKYLVLTTALIFTLSLTFSKFFQSCISSSNNRYNFYRFCRARAKEMANTTMQDNPVIDIIKLVRLEGLFRAPSREIDHCLISALVKRWRSKTHAFHLPHGEMLITLEDVEVILGLLVDVRSWLGRLLWWMEIGGNYVWSCLVLEFQRMTTKLWWGKEFSSVALLSAL